MLIHRNLSLELSVKYRNIAQQPLISLLQTTMTDKTTAFAENFSYILYYSPYTQVCADLLSRLPTNLESLGVKLEDITKLSLSYEQLTQQCNWLTGVPLLLVPKTYKIFKGSEVFEELSRYARAASHFQHYTNKQQELVAKQNKNLWVPITAKAAMAPATGIAGIAGQQRQTALAASQMIRDPTATMSPATNNNEFSFQQKKFEQERNDADDDNLETINMQKLKQHMELRQGQGLAQGLQVSALQSTLKRKKGDRKVESFPPRDITSGNGMPAKTQEWQLQAQQAQQAQTNNQQQQQLPYNNTTYTSSPNAPQAQQLLVQGQGRQQIPQPPRPSNNLPDAHNLMSKESQNQQQTQELIHYNLPQYNQILTTPHRRDEEPIVTEQWQQQEQDRRQQGHGQEMQEQQQQQREMQERERKQERQQQINQTPRTRLNATHQQDSPHIQQRQKERLPQNGQQERKGMTVQGDNNENEYEYSHGNYSVEDFVGGANLPTENPSLLQVGKKNSTFQSLLPKTVKELFSSAPSPSSSSSLKSQESTLTIKLFNGFRPEDSGAEFAEPPMAPRNKKRK